MSTYSALCDVPVEALDFLINLLRRHYRTHDHRSTQRGGTARTQATLVLRSFGDTTRVACLSRDHRLWQATAYRYTKALTCSPPKPPPPQPEALTRRRTESCPT